MDKKDIYEHLAKIYLDASGNKQKKAKSYRRHFKKPFLISAFLISGLLLAIIFAFLQNKSYHSEIVLCLSTDAVKVNFNFNPAKKEIYALNLNKLNLNNYKALGFSVKKTNFSDTVSLRVEFSNSFREKSEVYFKDIPHKWQDYKIKFSEFKSINDWSEMQNLSFAVEEWNTKEKKGVLYIDNVRLIK